MGSRRLSTRCGFVYFAGGCMCDGVVFYFSSLFLQRILWGILIHTEI